MMIFNKPKVDVILSLNTVFWDAYVVVCEHNHVINHADVLDCIERDCHLSELDVALVQHVSARQRFKQLPLAQTHDGAQMYHSILSYDMGVVVAFEADLHLEGDRCIIQTRETYDHVSYESDAPQYHVSIPLDELIEAYTPLACSYAAGEALAAEAQTMPYTEENLARCERSGHPLVMRALLWREDLPARWLKLILRHNGVFYSKARLAPHVQRTALGVEMVKALRALQDKQPI